MKRHLPAIIAVLTGCAAGVGVGILMPVRVPPRVQIVDAPATSVALVWVNTKTGVYHREGDRWYGATAQGKYMSESAAIAAGYRAAMN